MTDQHRYNVHNLPYTVGDKIDIRYEILTGAGAAEADDSGVITDITDQGIQIENRWRPWHVVRGVRVIEQR